MPSSSRRSPDALARRFVAAWRTVGGRTPMTIYRQLVRRYDQGRHYHDLGHIRAMFAVADELIAHPLTAEFTIAVFFHDAVYDPRRHDNELASAELVRDLLPAARPAVRERIAAYIRATEHHLSDDPDIQQLIDLDLCFLGAPRREFMANFEKLVREYHHLTREQFLHGQLKFAASILARPHLFYTPAFRRHFERRAHANLRALSALSRETTP